MKLYEFIALNEAKGFCWFAPSTCRFFRSRVTNWDYITGYFISSEKGPSGIRLYTLRKGNFESGNVETIGEFQQYSTLSQAKTALKNKLRGK